MSSIEEKVATVILSMIRGRQKTLSDPDGDLQVHPSGAVAPARLRQARFSDFAAVAVLKQRWGLDADSLENWERLWRRNPALAQMPFERPIGWVLEADGVVVGYLGNISLLYRYGDKMLTAVTAHGFVVDPQYRAVGVSLVAAFFRQKSADLYLATTAIEAVGKIALAFKAAPLPQPDYDTVLFWVLQPYPFAQALMKKLEVRPALLPICSILASLAVGTDMIVRRRLPKRSSMPFAVSEIGVNEIGDDFQSLWIEKLNEGPRLLADRCPTALRWHFEIPGDRGCARVLCCHKNRELLGYAVIRSDTDQRNGLRKSIIADMIARQDDPQVVTALWCAAYDHAKSLGSDILEVLGFPASVRRVCSQSKPYLRKYPACPFYYKAADPVLHKTLSDSLAWYASPFDGDATLIRPSYSSSAPPGPSGEQFEDMDDNFVCDAPEGERNEVF